MLKLGTSKQKLFSILVTYVLSNLRGLIGDMDLSLLSNSFPIP